MTCSWRLLVATLLFSIPAWAQQCYLPNGSLAPSNDTYMPCGDGSQPSQCCTDRDECTTNGLCKGSFQSDINWYWRESCTDPTWQSDACPKYCVNEALDSGSTGEDHLVFACSSTTYCCAAVPRYIAIELPLQNNYSCCNDPSRVFDAGPAVRFSGKVVQTSTFASTASPTSTSTSTALSTSIAVSSNVVIPTTTTTTTTTTTVSTPAASTTTSPTIHTDTPSSSSSSGHELTKGARVGVAIGVFAAVSILIGIMFLIRRHIRTRKLQKLRDAEFSSPIPPYEAPDHKALIPEMYVPYEPSREPADMHYIPRKPVSVSPTAHRGWSPIAAELPGRSLDTWI